MKSLGDQPDQVQQPESVDNLSPTNTTKTSASRINGSRTKNRITPRPTTIGPIKHTITFMYNIMIPLVSFLAALRILTHAQSCNNGVGRLVYEKVSDYGLSGLQLYPTPAQQNSNNNNNKPNQALVAHKIENLTRTDSPVRVLEECLKRCQEDRTTLISRCLSFDFIPGQRKSGLYRAPQSSNNETTTATQHNDATTNNSSTMSDFSSSESTRSSSSFSSSYHQLRAEYEPSKCIFYNERAAPDGQETLVRRNKEWHFNKVCLSSSKVVSQCQNRLYVFERIPGFRLDSAASMGSLTDQKELVANNRSDCQDKCLNEYRFPCRSATYDRKNKRCILSRHTRHVNLLGFRPDPNCDYLENACLTRQQMCHSSALIMETNKELNSIYERDLLQVQTFQQCYEQCQMSLETRGFLCRSFMYDEMGQTCLIYDEDPFQVVDMNTALIHGNSSTNGTQQLSVAPSNDVQQSQAVNTSQHQKYMSMMGQYYFDKPSPASSGSSSASTIPMHATMRSMRPSTGNLYRIICINSETGFDTIDIKLYLRFTSIMTLQSIVSSAKNYITNATIQCFHNKRFNGQHQVEIAAQNFYDCLQECLVRFNHNCKSIEFSSKKKLCKFSVFAARQLTSKANNLVADADFDYYKFVWHRAPSSASSSGANSSSKSQNVITNRVGLTQPQNNQLDTGSSDLIGSNYGMASTSISYLPQPQQQQQQQGPPMKVSLNQPMQSESTLHSVNAAPTKTGGSTGGVGSATMTFIPNTATQTHHISQESKGSNPQQHYSPSNGSSRSGQDPNNPLNFFTVYGQTSKSAPIATALPVYTTSGSFSSGTTQTRSSSSLARHQAFTSGASSGAAGTKTGSISVDGHQHESMGDSSYSGEQNSVWSNNQNIRTSNPPSSGYAISNTRAPVYSKHQQLSKTTGSLNHYSHGGQQEILNDNSLVPNQFVHLPHANTEKSSGYSYTTDNSGSPYTYTGQASGGGVSSNSPITQQQTQFPPLSNDIMNAEAGSLDPNSNSNLDSGNSAIRQQQQANNYNLRYGVLRSPHSSSTFNQVDPATSGQDQQQQQQQQQQIAYDRPGSPAPIQPTISALNAHHHGRIQFQSGSQSHIVTQHQKLDPKSISTSGSASSGAGGNNLGQLSTYTTAGGTGYSIGGAPSTNQNSNSYHSSSNIPSVVASHYSPNNVQSAQPQPSQTTINNNQISAPIPSSSMLPPVTFTGTPSNPCRPGFSHSGSVNSLPNSLESSLSMSFPTSSNANSAQQEPLYSSGLQPISNDIQTGASSVRYNRIGSGTRLRSQYIFKVIRANTLTDCERACTLASQTSSDFCRSFNYRGFFDAENCELSRHDSRQLKLDSPLHFEQHTQFDYYDRDTTQQQQLSVSASSLSAAYMNAPGLMAADCLEVTQSCTPDGMEFTLRTQEPFNGRIYTYGFYDSCFYDGESSTTSVLRISRTNGFPRCGTQQIGDLMTNIVVVQFNDYVQTTRDKKYNLTCYFSGYGEAVVTSNYLDTKIDGRSHPMQIEHLPSQNVVTSNVVLRVLYRGQPTNTIALGDLLTFRLEARSQYRYDLLNNEIFATNVIAKDPYTGRQVQLIDSRGCPLDPMYLFPELQKTPDGALESEFYAFKIPDSNFLIFQATVRTCKSPCEPIICTDTKSRNGANSVPSWGRRRRRRRRDTLDEEVMVVQTTTGSQANKMDPLDSEKWLGERELEPSETMELHSFTIPAKLKHSTTNGTQQQVRSEGQARNMPGFSPLPRVDHGRVEAKPVGEVAEEEVQEMFRVYASRDDIPKPKYSAQSRNGNSKMRASSSSGGDQQSGNHFENGLIIGEPGTICLSEFGYYSMVATIVSLAVMVSSVVCVAVYVMKKSKFAIKQVIADGVNPISITRTQTTMRTPVSSYMMYGCLMLIII